MSQQNELLSWKQQESNVSIDITVNCFNNLTTLQNSTNITLDNTIAVICKFMDGIR